MNLDKFIQQIPQPYQQYALPALGVVAALVVFVVVRALFSSPAPVVQKKKGSSKKETPKQRKEEAPKKETPKKEAPKKEAKKEQPKKEAKKEAKKETKKEKEVSSPKEVPKNKKKGADQSSINDMIQEEDDVLRRYANLIDSKKKYP